MLAGGQVNDGRPLAGLPFHSLESYYCGRHGTGTLLLISLSYGSLFFPSVLVAGSVLAFLGPKVTSSASDISGMCDDERKGERHGRLRPVRDTPFATAQGATEHWGPGPGVRGLGAGQILSSRRNSGSSALQPWPLPSQGPGGGQMGRLDRICYLLSMIGGMGWMVFLRLGGIDGHPRRTWVARAFFLYILVDGIVFHGPSFAFCFPWSPLSIRSPFF